MRLTDAHKRYIIKCMAFWLSPTETARAVAQHFGVDVPDAGVIAHYSPETTWGGLPSRRWTSLFNQYRGDAEKEVREIPVANKAYRLMMYQRIIERNLDTDPQIAMEALRKAGEEIGDLAASGRLSVDVTGEVLHGHLPIHGYHPDEISRDDYRKIMASLPNPHARRGRLLNPGTGEAAEGVGGEAGSNSVDAATNGRGTPKLDLDSSRDMDSQ